MRVHPHASLSHWRVALDTPMSGCDRECDGERDRWPAAILWIGSEIPEVIPHETEPRETRTVSSS